MLRTVAWIAALALAAGCSHRTLLIESTPGGAEIYLNRKPAGKTPALVEFRYGGVNEVTLLPPPPREGLAWRAVRFEVDTHRFHLDTPFLNLPADVFGSEDRHRVHVELPVEDVAARYEQDPYRDKPSVLPPILDRAEVLRSRARSLFLEAMPREPLASPEGAGEPPGRGGGP